MNAKAAVFSFSLFLVIFLLVAETTLAKPKALHVKRCKRNSMFLPGYENPEAIRDIVERNTPSTLIASNLCFGSPAHRHGSFQILRGGSLKILRVDYEPSLSGCQTKVLKLFYESGKRVIPEKTTSDNIHFDFRFYNNPLKVTARQKFSLYEESGSGVRFCVSVYGYYS